MMLLSALGRSPVETLGAGFGIGKAVFTAAGAGNGCETFTGCGTGSGIGRVGFLIAAGDSSCDCCSCSDLAGLNRWSGTPGGNSNRLVLRLALTGNAAGASAAVSVAASTDAA